MFGQDPFARQAATAAAAAPASPPRSQLDEMCDAIDSPLNKFRDKVKVESLQELHDNLYRGEARLKTVAEAEHDLERKSQLRSLQLRDGGEKAYIMIARYERYISLLKEQQQQQHAEKLRRRQEQHACSPTRARQQQQQHPPNGEQQAHKSKQWLAAAFSNQEEARTAAGPSPPGPALQEPAPGLPGSRQVVPKPQQPLTGSRDFRGLGAALPAARGAPRASKRHDQLLNVSGASGAPQWQQPAAARQGGKQQSLPELLQQHPPSPSKCYFCFQAPPAVKDLKRVKIVEDKQVVQVCYDCLQKNAGILQPLVIRESMGQAAAGGSAGQQPAQERRPLLPLRPTDHSSQTLRATPATHFVAGGEQVPQAGAARGPSRGKGKQPAQPRKRKGGSDEEYNDAMERRQRQQQQGQGGRSGRYGLPQDADSDSEFEAMAGRPLRATRRKQAVNAEPVCIDLLSDDDHGAGGEQQGAAVAAEAEEAPARRVQPARAAAYRSTAERFKGLKCLYPPGGGPGAVEVTSLDLARLDPDEFLNDTVIDFYLRWLQDQLPPEVASRCYFFNTFFFKKLMETSGGSLSEEVEAYAKQIGAKGEKLQTLRNHQKVKKWTKDVDLFGRDFIFVPVHEALHWSLMVVCHAGVVPSKTVVPLQKQAGEDGSGGGGREGDKASQEDDGQPGQPTPCILHMDSIKGSHRMQQVTNKLRLYLEFEWDLKALQGPPDSVPARWAAAHPGHRRRWYNNDFPARSLKVPKQDNHCDCGLFMCSYPEFLTYRLPRAVNLREVSELTCSYSRTNRDLYEGTDHYYPGLLTERWFPDSNPTNLRYEMRRQILELMAEQQGLGVRRADGEWEWRDGDPLADELAKELLDLNARLAENPYMRPKDWEGRGEAKKQERAAALTRRQTDAEQRKAARQQRQSAAAKRPADDSVDPDLLAAAAERRILGSAGAAAVPTLFTGLNDVAAQASDDSRGGFEREHLPRGGWPPGAEHRQQQQAAGAGLQPAVDAPLDGSQSWDPTFGVDLSGDEEEDGSAAREIVQGCERHLAAQGAAPPAPPRQRQIDWQAVVEGSDAAWQDARGAHPGSPPRSDVQLPAAGEEASPPRARKAGRAQRKRQQSAAGQSRLGQASDRVGLPLEDEAAAAGGGSSLPSTQDVGGSAAEETDGEFDIVQPQHHKRQRTSGALPYSSVAHARSDAAAVDVDWSQVALVAGVLVDAPEGGHKLTDVRIWYKDKAAASPSSPLAAHRARPTADSSGYHISIPFPARTTAASLEQLRAWQGRHAEELFRLDSSRKEFHQIDELECALAAQSAAQGGLAVPAGTEAHAAGELQQQAEGGAQRRRQQKRQRQAAEDAAEEERLGFGSQASLDVATGLPLQGGQCKPEGNALAAAEEEMGGLHLNQLQQQLQQQPWTAAAKGAAGAAAAAAAAEGPADAVQWQEDVVAVAGESEQPAAARRHRLSLLGAHPQQQGAAPAAGGEMESTCHPQPAHQQQQPLSKLSRKPSQPKHHTPAATGAALAQRQQHKQQGPIHVATAAFNPNLYREPPLGPGAHAEPAVPGQPPPPFGGLQPPTTLRIMQRAGSDVLDHAEPYVLHRPGMGDGSPLHASHSWRRRGNPSPPSSGQQRQQQQRQQQQQQQQQRAVPAGWEPGRPAVLDPRMANARPPSAVQQSVKQAAADIAADAEEQASVRVQQRSGWPPQLPLHQQVPATLSGAAVRGATAGLKASADCLRRQREHAEQSKLLSRKQRKQQAQHAEQDVINLE